MYLYAQIIDFLNFVYVPDKLRTKLLRSKMEDREFDRAGHEDCCQFKWIFT